MQRHRRADVCVEGTLIEKKVVTTNTSWQAGTNTPGSPSRRQSPKTDRINRVEQRLVYRWCGI